MNQDPQHDRLVLALCDLGLSRTEAEVYLACLDLAAEGPISSYRVAQVMGRDPANVGKILNTLVHQRAVQVVQPKPRLYVPVPPAEFSDQVLARMQDRRDEAVRLLESYRTPAAGGMASILNGAEQVIDQARELLDGCHTSALVCGSGDVLRELGHTLEHAAEREGCRVLVLSPVAFGSETVQIATLPSDTPLFDADAEHWLLLTVDDQAWLMAVVSAADEGPRPRGWWSAGTATARVLRANLELAWRSAALTERVAALEAALAAATAPPSPPPAETVSVRREPAPAVPAESRPVTAAAEPPSGPPLSTKVENEEGITFVFRRKRASQGGTDAES